MISRIDIEKIASRAGWLEELIYQPLQEIELEIAESDNYIPFTAADSLEYSPIKNNTAWGQEWGSAWFRGSYQINAQIREEITAREDCRLLLVAETGGESLVYIDGQPAGALDRQHGEILLQRSELEPGFHRIMIQSYAGHRVPEITPMPTELQKNCFTEADFLTELPQVYQRCRLVVRNQAAWQLYFDLTTLLEVARELPRESLRRHQLLKILSRTVDQITWETEDREKRNREFARAAEELAPELAKKNSPTTPELNLIGHAHIDIAWLWPLEETRRKCARTFATQLRLLKEYPDYHFIQSQAKAYQLVEEYYPDIFARVQEAAKSGRWEVEGAMWVESDTNLPSAESLIRQFLYGKKYFSNKFGVESRLLWLPDVFGYSGNLPQIMAGCGVDYFITSKIGWNDTNHFPYDLFRWQGIDGSEVLTHFIKGTYNGQTDPESLRETWEKFSQPEHSSRMIHSVGYGDGGGGVTSRQLELARRQQDLEGTPRASFGPVRKLMDSLAENQEEYPVWQGEIYLEYHRGTYTTQAWSKRNNRRLENLLREAEFFAALAFLQGSEYPGASLKKCWQQVLTNQFHDILPGTSIAEVYQDCDRIYGEVAAKLEQLIAEAVTAEAEQAVKHPGERESSSGGKDININSDNNPNPEQNNSSQLVITAWNTLARERRDLLKIPWNNYQQDNENPLSLLKKTGSYNPPLPELDLGEFKSAFDRGGAEKLVAVDDEGNNCPVQVTEDYLLISPGRIAALSSKSITLNLKSRATDKQQQENNFDNNLEAEAVSLEIADKGSQEGWPDSQPGRYSEDKAPRSGRYSEDRGPKDERQGEQGDRGGQEEKQKKEDAKAAGEKGDGDRLIKLENRLVRVTLDSQGQLLSYYDKELEKELIPGKSRANRLILAEDLPRKWDAWDIERYYRERAEEVVNPARIEVSSRGPLQAALEIQRKLGEKSRLKQIISLAHNSRRLDFLTWIDWQEKHRLLKTAFPLNIHCQEASFEIQGGYLTRPVHENTSWDRARHEVPAQRWAAFREAGLGAALLNDCKYGYEALPGELRLTLLKSAAGPDPEADQGQHVFTYSLLSFAGSLFQSEILSEARQLNSPWRIFAGNYSLQSAPFEIKGRGIELLTVKKAEKQQGIIIRLNESWGRKTRAALSFSSEASALSSTAIYRTNMLEEKEELLREKSADRVKLPLDFRPFEIKTLLLEF